MISIKKILTKILTEIKSINTKVGTVYANASNNNTISVSGYWAGCVTSSQKSLTFFVPYNVTGGTPSLTSASIVVRHADGGYPYARSGSSGGTYTQLGSSAVSVWNNSVSVRTNEVSSVSAGSNIRSGFIVSIVFNYALTKSSGNTTAVTNNVPVTVFGTVGITLSS